MQAKLQAFYDALPPGEQALMADILRNAADGGAPVIRPGPDDPPDDAGSLLEAPGFLTLDLVLPGDGESTPIAVPVWPSGD